MPWTKTQYDLPREEAKSIRPSALHWPGSDYLERDHEFLTRGGVFTVDMIEAYIELKRKEVERLNMTTTPLSLTCTTLLILSRKILQRRTINAFLSQNRRNGFSLASDLY